MRAMEAADYSNEGLQYGVKVEMKTIEKWLPVANPKYNRIQGGFFLPMTTAKNDHDGAEKWYRELSAVRGAMEGEYRDAMVRVGEERLRIRKERLRLEDIEGSAGCSRDHDDLLLRRAYSFRLILQ